VVSGTYYTDPFCPWCWAAEGAFRRLQAEYDVEITFVIAGLAREVDPAKAQKLALASLDAAADSGMPIDARAWLRDPPASTYPSGIAFHAVADQADPGPFLRRVREAVQLEGRRMDRADGLLDAAREAGGLDLERLRVDFGSHEFLERFGADLERGRAVDAPHHDPGEGRVALPTVVFCGEDGLETWVTGDWQWEAWRSAALAAGARPRGEALPDPEAAVRRFGSITTAEVATVTGLPAVRAAAELWRLATDFRVTARRVPGGELWSPAG
jgi:predicted DsbA family dithiol-disulfide isomerase